MKMQNYWYLGFLGFIGFYKLGDFLTALQAGGNWLALTGPLWFLWFLDFIPETTPKEKRHEP